MQVFLRAVVALLWCAVPQTLALTHLGAVQQSVMLTEAQEAEQEDTYLRSSWQALEKDMEVLLVQMSPRGANLLQVGGQPKQNQTKDHTIDKAKMEAAMSASKGLTGKPMLVVGLGMLHGLYDDQKSRIADINKHEQKSKDSFAVHQKEHDARMAHLKDLLDHHNISQGFYNNATKDQERMFAYWKRVREHGHKQFHTQLKLTHGLMAKEKNMIDAYDKALAAPTPSKADAARVEALVKPAAPEIVLLQARELAQFCREGLAEVRQELTSTSSLSLAL